MNWPPDIALSLRSERRGKLRRSENKVPRRMCNIPRKWQQEARRKCTTRIFIVYNGYQIPLMSRDSVVGIATSYGLDDRGVGVRVPVGSRIFFSPPNLLFNGYGGFFPGGKAAET
jgi:hypothetical protein